MYELLRWQGREAISVDSKTLYMWNTNPRRKAVNNGTTIDDFGFSLVLYVNSGYANTILYCR